MSAARDGLIAELGAKNWSTLCIIASFMNEKGECYPTQAQIARGLGVSRQTANKYIADLLAFRWQGQPVIHAVKDRDEHGRWENTRYTVLPVSQLAIFNKE
ncbi:helix-turn-helix domain-containing protein [Bacillus sp. JJ722]|uniref:helix-turn-helix domain-containing protein n=1 Tax=Bacillus sp. JJ722 TaxID=3122973 RepID=UPI003000F38D